MQISFCTCKHYIKPKPDQSTTVTKKRCTTVRIRHVDAAIPQSNLEMIRLRVRRPETNISTSTRAGVSGGQGWREFILRCRWQVSISIASACRLPGCISLQEASSGTMVTLQGHSLTFQLALFWLYYQNSTILQMYIGLNCFEISLSFNSFSEVTQNSSFQPQFI